mgnify:CR=1 FL=1
MTDEHDMTHDGVKGGQGRSAQAVRDDAIGLMWVVAWFLLACFVAFMFN